MHPLNPRALIGIAAVLGILALAGLLAAQPWWASLAHAQDSPSAAVELSADSVEPGTEITATMSFSNLESDSDISTTDYIFRADVVGADACEGGGMGQDRYFYKVDEDPETRGGTVSAGCPAGGYTVKVTLSSADNTELDSATAGFTIAEPAPDPTPTPELTPEPTPEPESAPSVAIALSPSNSVEEGETIAATTSFSDLEADSDTSTVDYIFRADVLDSEGNDADACEGGGMGVDRYFYKVDEDPETRTGSTAAECPAGDYTLRTSISSADNTELAEASAGFFILSAPVVIEPPTLTALSISHGDPAVDIALSPVFDSGTLEYRADVGVEQVTIAPTASDAGATVAYLDGNGDAIADADAGAGGHQVDLDAGSNTVKVAVSKDGLTTTYTVSLFRLVTQQQTAVTFIWSATITVAGDGSNPEWKNSNTVIGSIDTTDLDFVHGTTTFTLYRIRDTQANGLFLTFRDLSSTGLSEKVADLRFHYGDDSVDLKDSVTIGTDNYRSIYWSTVDPGWSADDEIEVGFSVIAASGTNNAPVFADASVTRSVDENTAAAENVGAVVTATDADADDTLTYTLEGTDAASFAIVSTSGQIQTKAALDYETKTSYTVTVKATDPSSASDTIDVTINVGDVDEAPSAPGAPTVTATSGSSTSLDVSWEAPTNTGRPDIGSYDLQYRQGTTGSFTDGPADQTGNNATITSLTASTSYEVQVRATNDEGDSGWSASGSGMTSAASSSDDVTLVSNHGQFSHERNFSSTARRAQAFTTGTNMGGYNLTSVALRIVTAPAQPANFTVTIRDASSGDAANPSDTIKYTLTNPATFTASAGGSANTFTAPADAVLSASTTYFVHVQYSGSATYPVIKVANSGAEDSGAAEGWSIADAARYYQTSWAASDQELKIQVVGSAVGGTNNAPVFAAATATRSVAENTAAGQNVGAVVTATDADAGDTLEYTLEGTDAASFDIVGTSGQIQTKAALDYETKSSYSVTVKASDGTDSATIAVTINVDDVDEAPAAPAAPTVAATSGSSSSLDVSWSEPTNTGPDINDYDVQYRAGSTGSFTSWSYTGTTRSTKITGLNASTSYQVQVRATNDEGTGDWSASGTGSTGAASNAAPVFATATATRSVAENTAAGQNVGAVVTATDADNDTLTYTLEGTDKASFDIVGTSGQIQTKAALDYEAKTSYSVTVKASDGTDSDTIAVTISVTNAQEAGAVSLSLAQVGSALTATLSDPDGGVSGETWVWASSTDKSTWSDISGATAASYTPVDGDAGKYLRATASYRDTLAAGQSAAGISENKVAAAGTTITLVSNTGQSSGGAGGGYMNPGNQERAQAFTTGPNSGGYNLASVVVDINSVPAVLANFTATIRAVDSSEPSDTVFASLTNPATFTDGLNTFTAPANTVLAATTTYFIHLQYAGTGNVILRRVVSDAEDSGASMGWSIADRASYRGATWASTGHSLKIQVKGSEAEASTNNAPVFATATATRSVDENTAAGESIGAVVTATDADGDSLTYTLAGTDAASFDIVGTSGQIQTKAALDHETKSGYSVTVKATDPSSASDTIDVTINVGDVDEAPSAPGAPTVTATSGSSTSLDVSWDAPANKGPAITDYDVQYRAGATGDFTSWSHSGITRNTKITGLNASTSYEVQVRATNPEGTGDWSASGTGSTGAAANAAPVFADNTATRSVDENTAAGQSVGAVVTATDADGDSLTYTLAGTDAASFDIVGTSGQIQTKAALDHETKSSYSVTVKASDGTASATIEVTINVDDVDEAPSAPGAPTVTATSGSSTSLDVSWSAPANTEPEINDYDVQYRAGSTGDFTSWSHSGTTRNTKITGLNASTSYEVQVRATNPEGTGDWSASGTGSTGAAANAAPVFATATATRSVDENTAAGQNVGAVVTATDADNDTLTYTLEGTDAASFYIVGTSGQIQTKAALDYETKTSYSVTVKATDPSSASDTIDVTINVTNVQEAGTVSLSEAQPRVGTALTATLSDPDGGVTGTTWVWSSSTDKSTWTAISGAAAASYTPVDGDLDRYLRARASYTDTIGSGQSAAGISENKVVAAGTTTLVSNTGQSNGAAPTGNLNSTTQERGQAFTTGANPGGYSLASVVVDINSVPDEPNKFTATIRKDESNNPSAVVFAALGNPATFTTGFNTFTPTSSTVLKASSTYFVHLLYTGTGDVGIPRTDGNAEDSGASMGWSISDRSYFRSQACCSSQYSLKIQVKGSANSAATGAPTISGTAQVGQTLTASTSGIADADGKTKADNDESSYAYTYQWVRVDSGTESDIGSATSSAYIPVAADEGKTLKVRVSFKDDAGFSESLTSAATGTVAAASGTNNAPAFSAASTTRSVAENTAAGENVGAVVTATDADSDTLTYTLEGTDAASFDIVGTSGQIQTKAALNYETKSSYSVTVKASDTSSANATITVTINVDDVDEAPSAPGAPTVTATSGSSTSLDVSWSVPANTGPDINDYDAQYRAGATGSFTSWSHSGATRSTKITGLTANTAYQVQVRATNPEGTGGWSASGTGSTAAGGSNNAPVFAYSITTRRVAENTAANNNIGSPVTATDADGDTLTYTLEGTDAASFDIVGTSGQIQTRAALDYETKSRYSVTVKASDGTASDTIAVAINVSNVNEAGAVSLSPALPQVGTALTATLSDPDGGVTGKTWAWASSTDKSAWTAISGAASASYTPVDGDLDRYLRATASYTDTLGAGRSTAGISANKVAAQGTNSAPVFADGTAKRSVAENTAADTNISYPVTATDADGDTLTYTLEGTDAASFAIVSTNGRLRTKAALDYETKSSYSVTVKASDGTDSDTIDVFIRVIDVAEGGTVAAGHHSAPGGTIWSAKLTSRYLVVDGEYLRVFGYQKEGSDGNEDQGALSDVDFVIGSDTYTVKGIRQWMETSRGYENDWLTVVLSRELAPADLGALTLHVSGVSFAFSKATDAPAADGGGTVYGWKVDWDGPLNWWTGSSLRFHSGVVHDVHITSSAAGTNARATGRPVITGTARIGETLEVDTSGIADANGLSNAAFKYQWTVIEADGAAGDRRFMSGATVRLSSWIKYRYGHLGKKLQVRVFFTDDAGNVESLLSETTDTIVDQE